MVKKYKQSDVLITLLLFTHVLSWVLFMPMAQIQLLLFGRRIFTFIHYGIIEMLLLLILVYNKKGRIHLDLLSKRSLSVIAVFLFSWLVNIALTKGITPFVAMFYIMNWIFPLLVIIVINQYSYDITGLFKFMLYIVIIHALIMWYQRFTNTIFWPFTTYEDGTVIFKTDTYYSVGKRMSRCIGLCTTALDAGILLLFGVVLTMILTDIKKWHKICLYFFFGVSVYFTGTRNVYVLFLFIIGVTFLMMQKISGKKKIRLLIFVTIVSCIVYFGLIVSLPSFNTTGSLFTDTTSIGLRLGSWIRTINEVSTGGIIKLLFGVMRWQNAGNCHVIDNIYLELLYCSGILAPVMYVKYIFDIAVYESKDGRLSSLICAGFTLSYCVYGVLNSTTNFFLTLIYILLLYCKRSSCQNAKINI